MDTLPTIKSLWIGERLSKLENLVIRSFLAHGHKFQLYCYGPLKDVPSGAELIDAGTIIPEEKIVKSQSGSFAMFADWFRYEMLLREGGVWADLDLVCLRPFVFEADYVFPSEVEPDGQIKITNGLIKAPKGSEVLRACAEICRNARIEELPWGTTGPYLFEKVILALGLQDAVMAPEAFCPLHWWQLEKIVTPGADVTPGDSSYAVHLWNECWRRSGLDKDALYPGSFYESLCNRYAVA